MEKGNYHHVLQAAGHKKNDQPTSTPPPEAVEAEPKPEEEPENNITQEQS